MAVTKEIRSTICNLVMTVSPLDQKEEMEQAEIVRWLQSDEPVFRVESPATPPKHLVVYCALLDEAERSLLLVDHVKAKRWLLPGGHVDYGENPRWTVERETLEELGIIPKFHDRLGSGNPLFMTITQTRGANSHTDVTLWFVLRGDKSVELHPDPREFNEIRWFGLDSQASWPAEYFDPEMHRFVTKLTTALEEQSIL